jgi:threonine/homoserine/homoserine lactone efflux protein
VVPRLVSGLAAVLVVLAGLGARAALPPALGGPLGDALYATLVVLAVVLVRPRTAPAAAAPAGLALCAAVELFQLTGAPAALAERWPLVRLVLGTTFWAPDLLRYAGGAALGWALCEALRAAAARRRPRPAPGADGST